MWKIVAVAVIFYFIGAYFGSYGKNAIAKVGL